MSRYFFMAAIVAMAAGLAAGESHRNKETGLTVDTPKDWTIDEGNTVVARAPDGVVSIVVKGWSKSKDAEDALMRLDRDEVLGNQIKDIRPAGDPKKKTIGELPAVMYAGTVKISSVKTAFQAAVVQKGAAYLVIFASGPSDALQSHAAEIAATFGSVK